jgi:ferredoxin
VLREDHGRGGSKLMHRIFSEGRKVFISRPINHFELDETATKSFLMGGGIGITPMIAFAHRLHALGGLRAALFGKPEGRCRLSWRTCRRSPGPTGHHPFSDEGTRADLGHGPHRLPRRLARLYLRARPLHDRRDRGRHPAGLPGRGAAPGIFLRAGTAGLREPRLRPEAEGRPRTAGAGGHTAADVLNANGFHVDIKCSDGICGVCKCGLVSGEVEHRDFVLSKKQRETSIILCQSRAKDEGGVIEIDL